MFQPIKLVRLCLLAAVFFCGLWFFPVDPMRVALNRWEDSLSLEKGLRERLAPQCNQITSRSNTAAERYFISSYAPTPSREEGKICQVFVETSSFDRFGLKEFWSFGLRVDDENGSVIFNRTYAVNFPRPLAFFPILLFIGMALLGYPGFPVWLLAGLYTFFLAGGNLISGAKLAFQSAKNVFFADHVFWGLVLISLWVQLFRLRLQRGSKIIPSPDVDGPLRVSLKRFSVVALGLWNPVVFTQLGRLLFPLSRRWSGLAGFFDFQSVVIATSLFLLSLDLKNLSGAAFAQFALPRYFTYGLLVFFIFRSKEYRSSLSRIGYSTRGLWRAVIAVLCSEGLSWIFPVWRIVPTIVRVGFALAASELVWPVGLWQAFRARPLQRSCAALFISALIAAISQQTGVLDLVLALCEPRIHPSSVAFFTYMAGVLVGILTGNFSASFFSLLFVVTKANSQQLVRAALVDGVLAGILLSPFSIFNLIPATQLNLPLAKVLSCRWQLLMAPMFMAATVYALSAVNAVSILRPVTFVFLCLVLCALHLSRRKWDLYAT